MHPVLAPAARRLWRDRETLQLGRGQRGRVLAGIDPAARAAVALLDGSRSSGQLVHAAAASGCPPERTAALLGLLEGAGLLLDADEDRSTVLGLPPLERDRLATDIGSLSLVRGDSGLAATGHRRGARLLVLGGGRVGAPLAALLGASGVGSVDVLDDHPVRPQDCSVGGAGLTDVGRSRGEAARQLLRLTAPSSTAGPAPADGPGDVVDLVVVAPSRPDQLEAALERVPPGVPHLLAEVRDTVGVVGPLVLPGRSACLRCLELTRTDLDPAWPSLSAQLAAPSRHGEACDGALAVMVAAQAALQVLLLLDGTADPASVGGTLEMALPDWRWRRRTWPVHPACGCAPAGR